MKILVVGGDGMLGHQLYRQWRARHDVRVTLHGQPYHALTRRLYSSNNSYSNIDVRSLERLSECIADFRPEVIVNAVGLIKQRPDADDPKLSMDINSIFPHRLALLAATLNIRVVQISTDCVFSGAKGNYREDDIPDSQDTYGCSKLLGELHYPNSLTLRTSIVGRELDRKSSLVEWFLSQSATVQGYARAIYSGLTTLEIARVIEMLILDKRDVRGLWHVSGESISKYDLLHLVRKHFKLNTEIARYEGFVCDRSLNSDRIRSAYSYSPPSWDRMIFELSEDNDFYK